MQATGAKRLVTNHVLGAALAAGILVAGVLASGINGKPDVSGIWSGDASTTESTRSASQPAYSDALIEQILNAPADTQDAPSAALVRFLRAKYLPVVGSVVEPASNVQPVGHEASLGHTHWTSLHNQAAGHEDSFERADRALGR